MEASDLMHLKLKAEQHLDALVLGTHPKTGHRLADSVLDDAEILRSLLLAREALRLERIKRVRHDKEKEKPERKGEAWSPRTKNSMEVYGKVCG